MSPGSWGRPGPPDPNQLLVPSEAASLLGVTTKTLGRWARAGRLEAVVTPGGHRRYRRHVIEALLVYETDPGPPPGPAAPDASAPVESSPPDERER